MGNNVSIATKPLVYSTFRYINNKVWNALAEYIDNSIQSFEEHKTELQKLNEGGKLHVYIDIDFSNDIITIVDDAYGITNENYQRAFELANLPLDRSGLNEFGMGMKVSSIWLSNTWSVETSALGETVKKIITFDLEEVVTKEEMSLPVKEEPCDKNLHYTKIILRNLSTNKPTSRQIAYVKKHLASIYTKYLRDKTIEIIVNGEQLEYTDLKILVAPLYSSPESAPVEWVKEICFEGHLAQKKYSVKGFIGVLETMSTSENNGFLLFRRGRVIGSSYDNRYRPKILCGQEGSPQYKRIFGELHLEGFDVSFTKNSFQEDEEFGLFLELLKEDLGKDKSFDIFSQAQYYTKPKTRKEIKALGENLIKQIARGFSQSREARLSRSEHTEGSLFPQKDLLDTIECINSKNISDEKKSSFDEDLKLTPIVVSVTLSSGETISLTIEGQREETESGLYILQQIDSSKYKTSINLKNPIFDRFEKSLATMEGLEQLAYVIEVMVATEISLLQEGEDFSGVYFRNKFNSLLGVI
ncbi:ATP-binding protein [Porphyromonas cangingivalis]|uniref:ATP-binding protein n=1 Tax=Porphyromonas cangingivalis TaxID=36874 RepID=UPI0024318AD5|nr:ATP-binding protein [Porphyromonas cangingivalis]